MAKQEGDARSRLQQSALALFKAKGYDQTTAAEIAAHSGVTERTFFRHFSDKREVLFDGQDVLRRALVASIDAAPAGQGPLALLFQAFRAVQPLLESNRPFAMPRQEIIAATPALQEREVAKLAALTAALAGALKSRGIADLPAALAAQAGMAAFAHATVSWLEAPVPALGQRMDEAFQALTTLLRDDAGSMEG